MRPLIEPLRFAEGSAFMEVGAMQYRFRGKDHFSVDVNVDTVGESAEFCFTPEEARALAEHIVKAADAVDAARATGVD